MRDISSSFALLLALGLSGCGSHHQGSSGGGADGAMATCAMEPRALAYAAGMQLPGMNQLFVVTLLASDPGPPWKGDNTWMLRVAGSDGAPADNLMLAVVPFMPDHGHGTPIKVRVTPSAGGNYKLERVNLFMAGLWQVTITIKTGDNKVDQVMFPFCIEG